MRQRCTHGSTLTAPGDAVLTTNTVFTTETRRSRVHSAIDWSHASGGLSVLRRGAVVQTTHASAGLSVLQGEELGLEPHVVCDLDDEGVLAQPVRLRRRDVMQPAVCAHDERDTVEPHRVREGVRFGLSQ